jgi:23S rRNA pseudouridine1911/1915/1917 synthase
VLDEPVAGAPGWFAYIMSSTLSVLYEDNHCLAVNKPAALLTQGVPEGLPTLEALARAYLKEKYHKTGRVYLGIPHRLDRPVSGVVLFARSSKAAQRLAEQFRQRQVTKLYWAIVEGLVDPPNGIWEDWLLKVPDEARTEIATAGTPGARLASLEYRVLERMYDRTLVEFQPRTGRSHQIRIQAASRGWPVLGDSLYGAKKPFGPAADLPRDRVIALHANQLTFLHPIRYEPLTVSAPVPDFWWSELSPLRVLPVIDLRNGVVVRGVGGRRDEYRPIVSQVASSSAPLDVAEAFRQNFGFTELYLADLDAISGGSPSLSLFAQLIARGFTLWVDAGLRQAAQADELRSVGVERLVAGLETLASPEELTVLCERYGEHVVFSLDLKGGRALGAPAWPEDPCEIAREAVECGVRRLLVLDLAQVGDGRGTGTEALCSRLSETFPDVEVCAGGGVRGVEDLKRLRYCGVRVALVASALHDGRLTRNDLVLLHGRHSQVAD